MTTLAGMDLGFGSQVKVVRTNYLALGHTNEAITAQPLANALQMYNTLQLQNDAAHLVADYVITINDNADTGAAAASTIGDAPSTTASTVVRSITTVPVMGPSPDHVAQVTGDGITATVNDTAANLGVTFSNQVLAVLNVGTLTFAGAGFTTPTALDLLGGVGGSAQLVYSELLCDGVTDTIDLTAVFTDLLSTSGLGADRAASTLDLSNALFNASFVQKGNAAGTTETVFGGIAASTVGAGTCGLISVVSLVKVA
jgi:hypothetical protein